MINNEIIKVFLMDRMYNKKCYEHPVMPYDVKHNCALWEYDQSDDIYVTAYAARQTVYYATPIILYTFASHIGGCLSRGVDATSPLGCIASFSLLYIGPAIGMRQNIFINMNDFIYSLFNRDEALQNTKLLNSFLGYLFGYEESEERVVNEEQNSFTSGDANSNDKDDV